MISEKQNGLERELAAAKVEEVFKGWAQEIYYHGILLLFTTYEENIHNRILYQTNVQKGFQHHQRVPELVMQSSGAYFIDSCFILQLRMFGFCRFEFDGDFLSRNNVCSLPLVM